MGVELEQEYDVAGFMGVTLEKDLKTGLPEMKYSGLVQRVIVIVLLDDGMSKVKLMPSEANPLVKDENGEPDSVMFIYSSVVVMIPYICVYTRTYIALPVKTFAWYMCSHKRSHKLALRTLACYLKQKNYHGLEFNTNYNVCKVES